MNEVLATQKQIIALMRSIECKGVVKTEGDNPTVSNYVFMFEDEEEEETLS